MSVRGPYPRADRLDCGSRQHSDSSGTPQRVSDVYQTRQRTCEPRLTSSRYQRARRAFPRRRQYPCQERGQERRSSWRRVRAVCQPPQRAFIYQTCGLGPFSVRGAWFRSPALSGGLIRITFLHLSRVPRMIKWSVFGACRHRFAHVSGRHGQYTT
jgi:hypothetical protein